MVQYFEKRRSDSGPGIRERK
uniref:Uncharacterized protein n=1 Tax=Panagrolaimus sp. JU765 TaxID=591449 RepID=A0AC34PWT3_9BILA